MRAPWSPTHRRPISFTSAGNNTSVPGMSRLPRVQASTLRHVTIQYAGSNSFDGSYGIRVAAGTPTIDQVTVLDTGGAGIGVGILTLGAGCPVVTNDTITNAPGVGVLWYGCQPSASNPAGSRLRTTAFTTGSKPVARRSTGPAPRCRTLARLVSRQRPDLHCRWCHHHRSTVTLHVIDSRGIFIDTGSLVADGSSGSITFTSNANPTSGA